MRFFMRANARRRSIFYIFCRCRRGKDRAAYFFSGANDPAGRFAYRLRRPYGLFQFALLLALEGLFDIVTDVAIWRGGRPFRLDRR